MLVVAQTGKARLRLVALQKRCLANRKSQASPSVAWSAARVPQGALLSPKSILGVRAFRSSGPRQRRDHYEVLGVTKSATPAEIKKAYYKLAKQYHPDTNKTDKDAASKFQEVQDAYETLSDDGKRARYDQIGFADEGMGGGGGNPFRRNPFEGGFGFNADDDDPLSQFFRNAAGGMGGFGGGSSGPSRGSDVSINLRLTFIEAAKGITKEVRYPVLLSCKPCSGTGVKEGRKKTCATCGGSGQEIRQQGFFTVSRPCTSCRGRGFSGDKCTSCDGRGHTRQTRTEKIEIPSGVEDDLVIKFPHLGNAGEMGGPSGHLQVHLRVDSSDYYKRDGANLYVTVPVSLHAALLGSSVTVNTLDGPVELKIKAGTQPGEVQRLRDRGINDRINHVKGHQFVTFKVELPKEKDLTKEQREKLLEFAQSLGGHASSSSSSSSTSSASSSSDGEGAADGKGGKGGLFGFGLWNRLHKDKGHGNDTDKKDDEHKDK